ncbi:MAG: hypothetical protein RR331_03055, partial [Bacteroides sp.]
MEDLLTFTGIIIIVFGILQIILFFKMWIMTNDVWKIKKHLIGCENDMYEYIIMGDNDKILRVLKKSFLHVVISSRASVSPEFAL